MIEESKQELIKLIELLNSLVELEKFTDPINVTLLIENGKISFQQAWRKVEDNDDDDDGDDDHPSINLNSIPLFKNIRQGYFG